MINPLKAPECISLVLIQFWIKEASRQQPAAPSSVSSFDVSNQLADVMEVWMCGGDPRKSAALTASQIPVGDDASIHAECWCSWNEPVVVTKLNRTGQSVSFVLRVITSFSR